MGDIAVFGFGGTISMTGGAGGIVPSIGLADIVASVGVSEPLSIHQLAATASANLDWPHMFELCGRLRAHFAAGGAGAVVVQGTDTIEETAFITALLGPGGGPVVFTGAMRGASALGADGPANLAAAMVVARDGQSDLGVVVAMNDEVHEATRVRKAHTTALGAFSSGDGGPLGRIHEGNLRLYRPPSPAPAQFDLSSLPPAVAVVAIGFGCGPGPLAAADQPGVAGCIIEAMGAGHVPEALAPLVGRLAARMPVVLASRTGAGRMAEGTYGYPGGEMDLLARGVMSAGPLCTSKARVALQACLGAHGAEAKQAFERLVTAL